MPRSNIEVLTLYSGYELGCHNSSLLAPIVIFAGATVLFWSIDINLASTLVRPRQSERRFTTNRPVFFLVWSSVQHAKTHDINKSELNVAGFSSRDLFSDPARELTNSVTFASWSLWEIMRTWEIDQFHSQVHFHVDTHSVCGG